MNDSKVITDRSRWLMVAAAIYTVAVLAQWLGVLGQLIPQFRAPYASLPSVGWAQAAVAAELAGAGFAVASLLIACRAFSGGGPVDRGRLATAALLQAGLQAFLAVSEVCLAVFEHQSHALGGAVTGPVCFAVAAAVQGVANLYAAARLRTASDRDRTLAQALAISGVGAALFVVGSAIGISVPSDLHEKTEGEVLALVGAILVLLVLPVAVVGLRRSVQPRVRDRLLAVGLVIFAAARAIQAIASGVVDDAHHGAPILLRVGEWVAGTGFSTFAVAALMLGALAFARSARATSAGA